jgi:hypothetical protein
VATGVAVEVTHSRSHAGQHYVSGHANPDQVTVRLMSPRTIVTSGTEPSRTCIYKRDLGTVYVPVRLSVRGNGAVTLHVTATVSDGNDVVATVTQDFPMESTNMGTFVDIPLEEAVWRQGSNDCAVTDWTMSPGAWFWNDD